jgi:hypothetical protein
MFRAILSTQWKWSRVIVLFGAIVAFAMPLASVQASAGAESAVAFLARLQRWGPAYAVLAAAIGCLVAIIALQPDHQSRHVYALSLPITRARYSALRLGAGAVFVLVPVAAILMGALLVSVAFSIPAGLHTYPLEFALRFAFASLVAYAIFFAIASSTPQTAGVVLGLIASVLLAEYLLAVTNADVNVIEPVMRFVFVRPGILSVFSGRWMLIDA